MTFFYRDCADQGYSWNVLHVAADRNSRQLLHLLERVPREDVDSMLVQQSKPHLNTVSRHTTMCFVQCLIAFPASSSFRGERER